MKNIFMLLMLSILALFSCQKGEKGMLTQPAIFNNNMVLQRNSEVPIWGNGQSGKIVDVVASWGEESSVKVDENGKWKLNLQTPKAGGPYTVKIQCCEQIINYENVLIGEVWVCSGQSNMEMPMRGWPPNDLIEGSEEAIKNSENPNIRLFTVKRAISDKPEKDCVGAWSQCNPQTVADFSATAYFFGRKIQKKLDIPIGLIHTSWGGTPAESWTPGSELKSMDDFKDSVEKLKNAGEQVQSLNQWLNTLKKIDMAKVSGEDIWRNLEFDDDDNSTSELDDSQWNTMELPCLWESREIGDFDGIIWFRKTVHLEKVDGDYQIELGPIDDMDVTYFNGKKIGGYEET